MHPFVGDPARRVSFSDTQLAAAFRLLRRYHDALGNGLVCHGDFGPWNLVLRDGLPAGMIDFDDVRRAEASEDVAYALRAFVSYGLAEEEPAELVRRTHLALEAYARTFEVPRSSSSSTNGWKSAAGEWAGTGRSQGCRGSVRGWRPTAGSSEPPPLRFLRRRQ
jgi:Ser/Thr protein kinase RdoA (MazF antagonist)